MYNASNNDVGPKEPDASPTDDQKAENPSLGASGDLPELNQSAVRVNAPATDRTQALEKLVTQLIDQQNVNQAHFETILQQNASEMEVLRDSLALARAQQSMRVKVDVSKIDLGKTILNSKESLNDFEYKVPGKLRVVGYPQGYFRRSNIKRLKEKRTATDFKPNYDMDLQYDKESPPGVTSQIRISVYGKVEEICSPAIQDFSRRTIIFGDLVSLWGTATEWYRETERESRSTLMNKIWKDSMRANECFAEFKGRKEEEVRLANIIAEERPGSEFSPRHHLDVLINGAKRRFGFKFETLFYKYEKSEWYTPEHVRAAISEISLNCRRFEEEANKEGTKAFTQSKPNTGASQTAPRSNSNPPKNAGEGICHALKKFGNCRKGSSCPWKHPKNLEKKGGNVSMSKKKSVYEGKKTSNYTPNSTCSFCHKKNHTESQCYRKKEASNALREVPAEDTCMDTNEAMSTIREEVRQEAPAQVAAKSSSSTHINGAPMNTSVQYRSTEEQELDVLMKSVSAFAISEDSGYNARNSVQTKVEEKGNGAHADQPEAFKSFKSVLEGKSGDSLKAPRATSRDNDGSHHTHTVSTFDKPKVAKSTRRFHWVNKSLTKQL
jgi:hypothetical protein